jgi:hypothetical protein
MFPASRIFLLVLLFSVSFPRTGFDLVPRFPSAFFGFGAEGPCAQDFSSCSRQFLRQVNFLGLDLVQRQYLIFLALILTACVLVFNFHCLALGLANLSARPHFSLSVFQPCCAAVSSSAHGWRLLTSLLCSICSFVVLPAIFVRSPRLR